MDAVFELLAEIAEDRTRGLSARAGELAGDDVGAFTGKQILAQAIGSTGARTGEVFGIDAGPEEGEVADVLVDEPLAFVGFDIGTEAGVGVHARDFEYGVAIDGAEAVDAVDVDEVGKEVAEVIGERGVADAQFGHEDLLDKSGKEFAQGRIRVWFEHCEARWWRPPG